MPKISPERVAISCVSENREPYLSESLCLFRSLNAFGGRMARARKTAYFVEEVSPGARARLEAEGVAVEVSRRYDMRCPCSNKLGMLDEEGDYDLLLAVDCDIVVARDFLDELDPDVFMGRVVGRNPVTTDGWAALYGRFGLTLPEERHLTMGFAGETPPFYNGGVLAMPRKYVPGIKKAWGHYISEMFGAYDAIPEVGAAPRYFTDEFALVLALASENIPQRMYPIEMNFPVGSPIHPSFRPDTMNPCLLHHHHRFSKNGLDLSGYAGIDRTIRLINKELSMLPIGFVPKDPGLRRRLKRKLRDAGSAFLGLVRGK